MVQKLDYYSDMVKEVFDDSEVRKQIDLFYQIDKMLACDYENPKELQKLSWIGQRKLVSTAPADASDAATRAFAARVPIINIKPLSIHPDERTRVENLETGINWELSRMNTRGKKSAQWKIIESAMRYCKVCVQPQYLPYALKDREKDSYIKAILSSSNFNLPVHHPSTVFAQDGPYGMHEFVVKRGKYSMNYLVSKIGKENKGIIKMLSTLDKNKDLAEQMKTEVYYFDVTTWKDRVQWASTTENGHEWEFLREEHGLPFINWIVVDNQDPILKSVVNANLWENANVIRTIAFSKAVDMAAHPDMWIQTPSGDLQGVQQDNENPSQPLVTDLQAKVEQLRPPQIDPQIESMRQITDSEIFQSSVAQILASVQEIGKTATFSTVNAMLQAALTQLVLAQNTAERAFQLSIRQMFQWIEYTEIPMETYRAKTKSKNNATYQMGEKITIVGYKQFSDETELAPGQIIVPFNSEEMYIDVTLQPKSITDKQAEITNEINIIDRLGGDRSSAFDRLDLGDYAEAEARRAEEDLTAAVFEAEKQRILLAPQEEMQQRAIQQQQEQQANIENQRMQNQNAFEGSQGFDVRAGGNPPAMPGMGREQITGETFSGEGLA